MYFGFGVFMAVPLFSEGLRLVKESCSGCAKNPNLYQITANFSCERRGTTSSAKRYFKERRENEKIYAVQRIYFDNEMEGKQESREQWQPRLCFVLKLASFLSAIVLASRGGSYGNSPAGQTTWICGERNLWKDPSGCDEGYHLIWFLFSIVYWIWKRGLITFFSLLIAYYTTFLPLHAPRLQKSW